jgi:hypothetical protein
LRSKTIIFLSLLIVSLFVLDLVAEAGGTGKGGSVYVRGYFRKDGTYVSPHYRSAPDGNPYNNWSYPGNVNPYTGKVAPGNPDTYLENYYNRKGSKTYSPYTSPSLPSNLPSNPPSYSKSLKPKNSSPNYSPLPKSSNFERTELERLFGPQQPTPIKQRSGGLNDVF